VGKNEWIDFLAVSKDIRSSTSVCLSVTSEKVRGLSKENQAKFLKGIASELSKKNIAHDVNSYKDAPPGFRFWCGPTIEPDDIKIALSEMEKVYNQKIKEL
jgi:phosphoserine aminotransferase